ncbi:MAG TPA: VWA domain-containing protein [bacterium]|nr:VWA domain-containing protein [bacterium]
MGFLQPVFLWGLIGVSVPVIIHLFSRKRAPAYFFSTIKFLKLTHKKTIRRQKIEEFIVLFLRIILIICLSLALAEPVNKRALFSERNSWVILILDDTCSMSAGTSEIPWKNLQKSCEQILSSVKKETYVSAIFNSGKIIPFSKIHEKIAQEIRTSQPTFMGNTMQSAINQASSMLEKKQGYKRIFIITDLQKSTWDNLNTESIQKTKTELIIIDVGEDTRENITIKDFYPVAGKNRYICEIINWTKKEIAAEIKFSSDGYEVIKPVLLQGSKKNEIEINLEKDCQQGKIELLYPDVLKTDNSFYIQKEPSGQKKVLIVGTEDPSVFYAQSSVDSSDMISADIKKINEITDVYPKNYRTMIMVNPQRIEIPIRQKIYNYILNGGTLIYFAGERIAPEDFNSDWFLTKENMCIMPSKIVKKANFSKQAQIAYIATGHPLFSEFGDRIFDYLKTTRFNSCFSTKDITGDILIKLDNGYPILIEKKLGRGRIFLFTFSPEQTWTNFQRKPFFPVMINLMIEYLSGSTSTASTGSTIVINGSETSKSVSLTNPDGKIKIIKNENNKPVGYVPDIPGIWVAEFSNENGAQKQIVAVNIPYTEGDPSKISKNEIREIFKKIHLNFIPKNNTEKILSAESSGKDLMILLLWISLFLLLAELILSNVFVFIREKGIKNGHG